MTWPVVRRFGCTRSDGEPVRYPTQSGSSQRRATHTHFRGSELGAADVLLPSLGPQLAPVRTLMAYSPSGRLAEGRRETRCTGFPEAPTRVQKTGLTARPRP